MVALAVAGSVGAYRATRPHDLDRQKVTVGADPSSIDPSATSTAVGVLQATTVVSPAGVVAPGGSGVAQADLPQATLGGTTPNWTRKAPKNSLMNTSYTNHVVASAGTSLLALSTAPGVARDGAWGGVADTLYRTTDGVEWTPSTKPAWISQIAGAGDRLYAVGTAPAEVATRLGVAVGTAIAGTSTDGGRGWNQVALPALENTGPKGTRLVTSTGSLTAGARGALVTVSAGRVAYVADLVPGGIDSSWGVTTSPAGISVLGRPPAGRPADSVCPSSQVLKSILDAPGTGPLGDPALFGLSTWVCVEPATGQTFTQLRLDQLGYPVAHTYTWGELGTTWEQLSAPSNADALLYSADGETFEAVSAPWSSTPNVGYGPAVVTADDDGFLAVATVASAGAGAGAPNDTRAPLLSLQSYRSDDGRTWTAGAPVAGLNGLGNGRPGRLADGRWAMLAQGGSSPVVLTSADGLAWDAVSLRDITHAVGGTNTIASVDQVDVGPHGMTLSAMTFTDQVASAGGARLSKSGVTLTVTDQQGSVSVVDDATGAVLGTGGMWAGSVTGALRVEQRSVPDVAAVSPTSTIVDSGGAPVATTAGAPRPICADCVGRSQPVEPELVVLDPSGAERVRFTNQEVNAALERLYEQTKTAAANDDPRGFVLTSADGATWAATDLSEVAGEPISMVAGIDHLGDKVVVRAQTKRVVGGSPNSVQVFAQLALVATFG